ncbi:hypothetical protein D3C78_1488300 [compost metagenome]
MYMVAVAIADDARIADRAWGDGGDAATSVVIGADTAQDNIGKTGLAGVVVTEHQNAMSAAVLAVDIFGANIRCANLEPVVQRTNRLALAESYITADIVGICATECCS